jgi:two-component system, chemotaxis family, CheB/CheR fusion protein
MAEPTTASKNEITSIHMTVGIGASAGGHEALEQIFTALPADSGLSFVVVMHLAPDGPSLLADLLRRHTTMQVLNIEDGMPLQPNTIHVPPPGKNLLVSEGRLRLPRHEGEGRQHQPIDVFFDSLAGDLGPSAIAVVLSGFGSDGSKGVKKIKESGGIVLVQDPETATNPFMPQNAIATGAVDAVLSAKAIGERLAEIAEGKNWPSPQPNLVDTSDNDMWGLFAILKGRTGHDFSSYKRKTVSRRIERRMAINGVRDLRDYLPILDTNPEEARALSQELLIGVTSFFRDPQAFQLLQDKIIPTLFANRKTEEPLRIWHACCATGEEAYSVAMLILEHIEKKGVQAKVQVFATDLDETAVAKARAGLYTNDLLSEVSKERRNRFFTKTEGRWQVTKELREMIVFAHHNIIKDPPFSRLDFLVCRNFLIYLNPDIQKLLIPLFHQVLNPGGYLFLGSAETVGIHGDLFTPIDTMWKIFMRQGGKNRANMLLPFSGPVRKLDNIEHAARSSEAQETATLAYAQKLLLERYIPARIIINEKNEVVHFSRQAGEYLLTPEGKPTKDILKIAREELRPALRAAIYKAFTDQKEIVYRGIKVLAGSGATTINLIVMPMKEPLPAGKRALVIVEAASPSTVQGPCQTAGGDDTSGNTLTHHLEEQLRVIGEQLQSTSEQLETSNERFLLANEELMTVNEELQSTNEELQSTNEELVTVNSELQRKMEELNQSNSDLQNLFTSSEIATIFLNRQLLIKRFSPAMAAILNLLPADVDRPVHHLNSNIDWSDLASDATSVLEKLITLEREVKSRDGCSYIMRVLPYRTTEGVIDGIVVTLIDISERKRTEDALYATEKALREGDERLQFALENCHIGAWDLDLDNHTAYRSLEHDRIFGYTELLPEWGLGTFLEHALPEYRQEVEEMVRQATADKSGWTYECRIRRVDGQIRWIWFSGRYVTDASGHSRVVGVVQDITARKEIEEQNRHLLNAVQEEKDKLSALINGISDEVWYADTHKRFTLINPSALQMFGLDKIDELDIEKFAASLEVFRPDGNPRPVEEAPSLRALQGEVVKNQEEIIRNPVTGELRNREVSANPVHDLNGDIIGAVAVARDITDLKHKEDALRQSELQYRTLFDTLIEGFCTIEMIFDIEGRPVDYRFLETNPAFEKQTGLHNVQGKLIRDVAPDNEDHWFEIYGKVALTGETVHFENEAKALDRYFDVCAYRIGGPENRKVAILFSDITERKRNEEALRLSEERRSMALEAAQAGTWEWDLRTNENIWSDELWHLYGLDKFSCAPSYREWQRIVHPDDLLKTEQVIKNAVLQGTDFSSEWRVKLADGTERWLMSRGRPLKDLHGCALRYLGTVIDITDRKRTEVANKDLQIQLLHAQKMEAIGTLAGGIAHDFNNILGAVIGYSEIVREDALSKSVNVQDVDQILQAGHRAKELVQQILTFGRQAQNNPILINPKNIVTEAIKLLRASLPTTIFIKQDINADVGHLVADPIQLHQIVMNLCTNSFHAMEIGGGTLSISLKNKVLGNDDVHELRLQPGPFIQLSITDTGVGIGPDIREKIFDPYFTTKEVGKGTGMGLAMVHGIVQNLGGSITFESRVGEGTTFHILLPAVAVETVQGDEAVAFIPGGKEHILLIDDEEILNNMGKTMLERLGYRVTAKNSSVEALATFQNQPNTFDLVITDMTMPGMTGIDLARRILQIRPETPIILCTGYSSLISEEKARSIGIKGFAMKPLTKKDISTLIRDVLEGKK